MAESRSAPVGSASVIACWGSFRLSQLIRLAVLGLASATLAQCSSGPLKSTGAKDPAYGVAASPQVVQGTERIDPEIARHGVYLVGKPYTVAGKVYVPREDRSYSSIGLASWYGDDFHGRLTANGEVFDMHDISAAHTTMPLPSYARVTNLANGRSILVRVNDRGPYHGNRVIDVSRRAAELLAFETDGVGRVKVDYVGPAQPTGSDEAMLVASLKTDGSPASLPDAGGARGPVMVAEAAPPKTIPALGPASVLATQGAPAQGVAERSGLQTASVQVASFVLPPHRPSDIDAAAQPIGLRPMIVPQLPVRTAAMAATPAVLSGAATERLQIGDIVPAKDPALGYAASTPPPPTPARSADGGAHFVAAGLFNEESRAKAVAWVLQQVGSVDIEPVPQGATTAWRVVAGPFADENAARAAEALARGAGADKARVM